MFEVVLPRNHPLVKRRRPSLALAELANFPLVSLPYESRTRRIIDGAASAAGLTLKHAVTVTQFATMMSFVRAGVGLAIIPSGAITGLLGRDLAVLKLARPRLSREVGLIWLRDRELTPAARGLAAVVEEIWRKGN